LKRGNINPATAKLGSWGAALQQLRDQFRGKPPQEAESRKAQLPAAAATASSPIALERASQSKAPFDPLARREEVARRLRGIMSAAAPRVEERPNRVSRETTLAIDLTLERGTQILSHRPEPDMRGYIVGFDLGTSSVKCAYRQPYTAGDPIRSFSVAPELQSFEHPCLWQTVLWFEPESKRFSLLPTQQSIPIDGFKSGLIRSDGKAWASADVHVSKAEAMVAYMAMMIAYVIGNYDLTRPLGTRAADHFLSVNMGIPVAACDDHASIRTYEKMLAAAHDLAPIANELTLADVRTTYSNARPEKRAGFEMIPELTAAIAGYAANPTAPDGAHILVDVGASTLDIVAFNLINRTQISVFSASVELLGAAALEEARSAGISDDDFKRACDHAFEEVYGRARHPRRAPTLFHPAYRRRYVQLVKIGGGCHSPLHEKFIAEMNKVAVLGDAPAIAPEPPPGISDAKCDKARLLLAYGLTRDLPELLALRLPSEIGDLPVENCCGPQMITKDDV
jgi:hypothetical protein